MKVNWYEQMTVNDHLVFFQLLFHPLGVKTTQNSKHETLKKKNAKILSYTHFLLYFNLHNTPELSIMN